MGYVIIACFLLLLHIATLKLKVIEKYKLIITF